MERDAHMTPMETPVDRTFYIPSPENSSFPQSPLSGSLLHVP